MTTWVPPLVKGPDDTLVQHFNATLLLLAGLGLRLDDISELGDVILNLLDIVRRRDGVTASLLLDVGFELAHLFTDDLGVDDVALFIHVGVRSGGERD